MAESRYTAKTLLVEVDNAIQRILVGGQSVKIGSRNLTRADLSLLLKTRNDLNAQIAAEGESSLMSFPPPKTVPMQISRQKNRHKLHNGLFFNLSPFPPRFPSYVKMVSPG